MNDEQAHHAQSHLSHLIMMRVIHMRAVLAESELVFECLARLNCLLVQPRYAIHAIWQKNSVPVHRGGRGQSVRYVNANAVAFDCFNRWTVNLAVVAPAIRDKSRRKF